MNLLDLLSRSRDMEALETPKCSTSTGYHHRTLPAHFKLDAGWRPVKLSQKPQRRPTCNCMRQSVGLSHADPCYQLAGVAEGLCYLHSRNVIHGDLKGVCGPDACFAISLTSASKTSSWTTPDTHGSQILASRRSRKTWIP